MVAARALVALTLACAVAACGPYRSRKPVEPPGAAEVIEPERTRRGNPPFYEVMGQRYHVEPSSAGYHEQGIASWYGKKFHGKPTASGEIFDMNKLTAAHKTLPIPTWVEVTNLRNGATVIVKVNDRGPFIGDRLIDLSFGAARALGMVRAGTTQVEIRALGVPAAGPAGVTATLGAPPADVVPLPPAEPPLPPGEPLYVQVGAFGDPDNALRLVERLQSAGFRDAFVIAASENMPELHRVRIGPIESVARFDAVLGELAQLGLGDARLVTID